MGTSLRRASAIAIWVVLATLCACAADAPEGPRTDAQGGSDRDGSVSDQTPDDTDRDAGDARNVDAGRRPPAHDAGPVRDADTVRDLSDASTPSTTDARLDAGTRPMPVDEPDSGPDAARDAALGADSDASQDQNQDASMGSADAGAACDVAFRAGHGDIHATYDGTEGLRLHLRSHLVYPGPGGLEPLHDPAGICIIVPASSRARVVDQGGRPADGFGFEPIGVGATEGFWFLSNSNLGDEQPFFGVSTEGVEAVDASGDVHFDFERLDRPAGSDMSIYRVVGIEPQFFLSTAEPTQTLTGSQRVPMPAGGHDHYLWSFTQPGVYDVAVRARLETPGGSTVESPLTTYRFIVES